MEVAAKTLDERKAEFLRKVMKDLNKKPESLIYRSKNYQPIEDWLE